MKNIRMSEAYSAEDLQALVGCTITDVTSSEPTEPDENEMLSINCRDADGGLVSFLILGDGTWQFYDGKEEKAIIEQFGKLAMLTTYPDMNSVQFNSAWPLAEIVIKPKGVRSADRVITLLKEIFPVIEVIEDTWVFEGETLPIYHCDAESYDLTITVSVLPEA